MNQIVKFQLFIKTEAVSEAVLCLINNVFNGRFTHFTKKQPIFSVSSLAMQKYRQVWLLFSLCPFILWAFGADLFVNLG